MIFIGIWLAIAYWVSEAYFDSLLVEHVSFASRLFPSDSHELWMRSFISTLFIGFGLYSQWVHNRIQSVDSMNLDAARLLKNALSNTIRGDFSYCVYCKKIHTLQDQWVTPEKFIADQTEAELSAGLCGACQKLHVSDAADDKP
jgi:hypothetical protein